MLLKAGLSAALLFASAAEARQPQRQPRIIDAFDDVANWRARASERASLDIASAQGALRIDFNLPDAHAWGIVRRAVAFTLPADYDVRYGVLASGPVRISLRLLGADGGSARASEPRRPFFPLVWDTARLRARHFEPVFPLPAADPSDRAGAIEFVITADTASVGTIWIDDLILVPRPPVQSSEAVVTASSTVDLQLPERAFDGNPATVWRGAGRAEEWLAIDFGAPREFGGLAISWGRDGHAVDYVIEFSGDGVLWRTSYTATGSTGGRDWLYMPESESQHVRIRMLNSASSSGYIVRDIEVLPVEHARSKGAFFRRVASDAPAGAFPRHLLGGTAYYTVAGAAGGVDEIAMSEDGAVEIEAGGPLLEPFLLTEGGFRDWADVRTEQRLVEGDLPIPEVRWLHADSLMLTVTALVAGEPGATTLLIRYRVENHGAARRAPLLFVAVRPFEVTPSKVGRGVARIDEVGWDGAAVIVNGTRRIVPLVPPASFGSATFMQGDIVDSLRTGQLPARPRAVDLFGHASAALAFSLDLPPAASRDVVLAVPLDAAAPVPQPGPDVADATDAFVQALARAATAWRDRVGSVEIDAPVQAEPILRVLRSSIAYLDIHADRERLQSGSRSGESSRLARDAPIALTLLRLGRHEQVRAFIERFASAQSPDGRIPCCIDARGAWPGPGNDSRGPLLSLIAAYYRHTADTAFVERQWPVIERAVAWIDSVQRVPERSAGSLPLLDADPAMPPPRGWADDLHTLRGLVDAVDLAEQFDRTSARQQFARALETCRDSLIARVTRAMERHGIEHLPLSYDDAIPAVAEAATALLLDVDALERAALATLERAWQTISARREARISWNRYPSGEIRGAGAFLRLGWTARAHDALDMFLSHRRPTGWNQWLETITREERPVFPAADMPHGGAAAEYISAVLDLFAFVRDDALILGAGIPAAWLAEGDGVSVRGLSTPRGALDLSVRAEGTRVHIDVAGDLRVPPGGIRVRSPLGIPVTRAVVDGVTVRLTDDGEVRLDRVPAAVILYH